MYAIIVTLLALSAPVVWSYDEKYDKIDVDKILADDTMFSSYIDCMLDKGKCELEHSADFRELLPEVIATACSKCNKIQRANVRKSVKAIQDKKPDKFEEIRKKYDPKGEYEQAFIDFLVGTDK